MLAVENYYKKTPTFWKRIGDAALLGIPLISTAIVTSPLGDNTKMWAMFICNILLAAVKMITKFIGDAPIDNSGVLLAD